MLSSHNHMKRSLTLLTGLVLTFILFAVAIMVFVKVQGIEQREGRISYRELVVVHGKGSQSTLHAPSTIMLRLPDATVRLAHSRERSRNFRQGSQFRSMLAGRAGGLMSLTESPWRAYRATWYTYQGGVGDGTITATGTHVREAWTIAVDPRVIPLGSLVEVRFPSGWTHVYQALDTGGAIRGQHIDIFDTSLHTCLQNGVQHIELRVLSTGPRHSLVKTPLLVRQGISHTL